ncbi:MAG TPA: bpX6 domain-containing protein [Pyrinomonadaceae bacterium]|nr:bpX6 domain-containing protein [Pyrinomonadaceae bacterium]
MKTLILQNLTHRGTVSAEGLLFSPKILSENVIRQRILSLWQPNTKIFRYQNDFILLFPHSFRIDCRYSIGLPLVRFGNILSSFPLQKQDLEHFRDFSKTILLSVEGNIETVFIKDLAVENLENWFDVSSFQIIETTTLGEVKTKPIILEKIENVDLREELKDVPKADEKLAEILQVLKEKKAEMEMVKAKGGAINTSGFSGSPTNSFGNLLGGMVGGVASGIFKALSGLFSKGIGQSGGGSYSSGGQNGGQGGWQSSGSNQPKTPGFLQKMFTKMMFQMKIAQLVGRKQAQYLAKMMEMFENGDLSEALKHAIPLEDMQALKEMSEQMPFLGFLRPRSDLSINYGRQTTSSSAVHLEDQWFNDLRQLYRQTFDRLVAQNRIEEAAFVLAELLKSNHEAVEFLEKHGKFRLAAELAESRNLSKEIIVRQWFLAGEKRKAVQLAVLHNCFEYVVTQLEKQNHPNAAELREIWAENLAESGNYPAAVNTIWQLKDKREKAKDWIDKVIEFGGTPSAQMLVKKASLFPATFDEVKIKLQEILAENTDEAQEKRAAFAHEALRLSPSVELRTLARPLIRKLLSDISKGSYIFTPNDLKRIVDFAQDYTLRTDLPKVPPSAIRKAVEPLKFAISANDKGSTQIYDACLLPDGKVALALGEAGVKIISKNDKTIAHFDQPTERFIVSDLGTKAICLANRGDMRRLSKIDFVERKASYWCDAKFDYHHTATFDGNILFVAERDNVFAIDTNAKNFEAIWNVTDLGGQILEINRSKSKLMLLLQTYKGIEKWWYELPSFTLRSRNETKFLEMENEHQLLESVSSYVAYSLVQIIEKRKDSENRYLKIYDYDKQIAKLNFPDETVHMWIPPMVENKFVIIEYQKNGYIFTLYETPDVEMAQIKLPENKDYSVRLDEKNLTITDVFGRVIIFDHQEKILRKNVRI